MGEIQNSYKMLTRRDHFRDLYVDERILLNSRKMEYVDWLMI
jgi:hypothetical protein